MGFILTAALMFAFWILLSGEFTPVILLSGVISSFLVAYLSHDLLIGGADLKLNLKRIIRFVRYLPWLFWKIALANIDLVYRTLHPKLPIDPVMIRFKNDYESEMGMVVLANSITLTPGTVTVDVNENEFIVHAIAIESADCLESNEMQRRVKKIEGARLNPRNK